MGYFLRAGDTYEVGNTGTWWDWGKIWSLVLETHCPGNGMTSVWPQGRDLGWVQISVRHPVEPVNRLGQRRSRGQRAGFAPSGFRAFAWPRVGVGVSLLLSTSMEQRIPLSNLKLNYMLMTTCLARIVSRMHLSNVGLLDQDSLFCHYSGNIFFFK